MLIQVDVDSTLYDADKLFDEVAREAGICWPRRSSSWSQPNGILKDDGTECSRDDLVRVFRKAHSPEWVNKQKPYPHAVKVLTGLVTDFDDIEIAYVSDRHSSQQTALRNWLDEKGFLSSPDQHVVATKDKRQWMREKRPSVVIDDRVRTILMARYELGSYVVSLRHNHNINLLGEADHIYIENDWKAIDKTLRDIVIPKVQEKAVSRERELQYA
jgi:hypothetical protein